MTNLMNKIIKNYCTSCRADRMMEIISIKPQTDVYWLKCEICHRVTMINNENLQKKQILNKNYAVTKACLNNNNQPVEEYKTTKTYQLGQKLYHPVLDDEGVVIDIDRKNGDVEKIHVKFEKIGKKILVQGIKSGRKKK